MRRGCVGDALPAQIVKTTTYADKWTEKVEKTSACWCPINGATRVHLAAQAEIWYSTRPLAFYGYCEGLQSVTDSPVRYDCKLAIRKVEIYQFVAQGLRTFLLVLRFC
jgi:hypothetical protein